MKLEIERGDMVTDTDGVLYMVRSRYAKMIGIVYTEMAHCQPWYEPNAPEKGIPLAELTLTDATRTVCYTAGGQVFFSDQFKLVDFSTREIQSMTLAEIQAECDRREEANWVIE